MLYLTQRDEIVRALLHVLLENSALHLLPGGLLVTGWGESENQVFDVPRLPLLRYQKLPHDKVTGTDSVLTFYFSVGGYIHVERHLEWALLCVRKNRI